MPLYKKIPDVFPEFAIPPAAALSPERPGLHQPLPHDFEQADAGGYGDVEAGDGAEHGDFDEEIAVLGGEAAHAGAFGADDDADGAVEIDFVDEFLGFIGGADEPDTGGFEFLQAAGEVGDLNEGDFLGGSAGDVADGVC